MAIYQGKQGIAFQGGGNSMFSQLNAAMQRAEESRQIQREDNFYDKLNTSGLLGAQSTDFFGSNITADGNINLGDKEGAKKIKSWKEHYNEIAPTGRDIRKTFGRNVSRKELETLFKNKSAERDMEVFNAIKRRMEEKGTGDIYKVVPKKGEEGGEAFEQWYNSITNDEVRQALRTAGYQPGQEELAFTPDFIEKRLAQGKSLAGYGGALAGAGYLGAVGAKEGRSMLRARGVGQYREALSGDKGQKLRDLKGTNKRIAQEQKALSDERAKLKKQLKDPKLSKKNAGAINKRIAEIDKEKKKLTSDRGKFKRGGQAKISQERERFKNQFRSDKTKGLLGRGKEIGGNIVTGIGGQRLGGAVGEAVGGDTGRVVGELGGGFGIPYLMQKYGKQLGTKGGARGALLGGGLYLAGSLLDTILND